MSRAPWAKLWWNPQMKEGFFYVFFESRINTGWWFQPLWKIWVRQLGWLFHIIPNIWKNKSHVPVTTNQNMNQQPVNPWRLASLPPCRSQRHHRTSAESTLPIPGDGAVPRLGDHPFTENWSDHKIQAIHFRTNIAKTATNFRMSRSLQSLQYHNAAYSIKMYQVPVQACKRSGPEYHCPFKNP